MRICIFIPLLAIVAAIGLGVLASAASATSSCAEDDQCWTWPTMGNHRRGVVTMHGNLPVVGPCRFARMARRHAIDWSSTPRLRGDRWAIAHGCDRPRTPSSGR